MKKLIVFLAVLFVSFQAQRVLANEVLATVDGKQFSEEEVMKVANRRMVKVLSQIYEIKRGAIEHLIDDYLLEQAAKKKGTTIEKLKKEVQSTAGTVTESEAKVIFDMNKKRFKNKTFEDAKNNLMKQIKAQKQKQALSEYVDGLRKKAKIQINIKRPRMKVSVDDDPGKGNKNAPIVLIEFSDFQCPFCKRARPSINKILENYKDKVYYVFRDYPLSFHQRAKDAANAANCANEQGKYWEFNNKIWDDQRTVFNKSLSVEALNKVFGDYAKALGLDTNKFNQCVATQKYFKEIEKDLEDGLAVGVTGTPAYFVNGMFLSGMQPYESFKEIIDEELKNKSEK